MATRKLRDAGFDEKQSKTVVRVLADAQDSLVTREHFDFKFSLIDAKLHKLSWMLAAVLALAAANFAKHFF